MVNEVLTVILNEKHLSEKFAGSLREPLPPDNRYRVGPSEHSNGFAPREVALLSLVLLTHKSEMIRIHDHLQSLSEVADMPIMIYRRKGIHQVIHDRTCDGEDFVF